MERVRLPHRGDRRRRGTATTYAYNGNGQLVSFQNPLGLIGTQVYNGVGQVIALINPLGAAATYTYNANGLVQTAQDPLGHVTTYLRDQVNRLTDDHRPAGEHQQLPVRCQQPAGADRSTRWARPGRIPTTRTAA